MSRTTFVFAVSVLALTSATFAQVSFDGCTKNCLSCQRAGPVLPAPGANLKTCDVCFKSSQKVSSTVPLNYDCSGPAIANCETHFVERLTGVVTCASCNDGFLRKVAGTVVTCETLTAEFQNCRRGTTDTCTLCAKDHTLTRAGASPNF